MGDLKAAVETVASFGKPVGISSETSQAKSEEVPISNRTVTKTVTGETVVEGTACEVIENIGAGDGI